MSLKKTIFFITLFIIAFSFFASNTFAAKDIGNIDVTAGSEGMPLRFFPDIAKTDVVETAGDINQIASIAIGILTVVGGAGFLIMFFLGGIRWLSSSGKPEQLERAKSQLTNSAVGLIIMVAAFGISYILGTILNINVLNPGDYLLSLIPSGQENITSLAEKYDPITGVPGVSPQIQANVAGGKFNTLFSMVLGTITLFGAIFFIIYFILGSLQWLTSGGVPERIEKAKKQITAAIIGLIVVVAAYSVAFIVGSVLGVQILNPGNVLINIVDPNPLPAPQPTTCPPCPGDPTNTPCCGICAGSYCAY